MNVSRFEIDGAPRPADCESRRATDDPHVAMHPVPPGDPGDPEDPRSEEPAEEPGYGHGV